MTEVCCVSTELLFSHLLQFSMFKCASHFKVTTELCNFRMYMKQIRQFRPSNSSNWNRLDNYEVKLEITYIGNLLLHREYEKTFHAED